MPRNKHSILSAVASLLLVFCGGRGVAQTPAPGWRATLSTDHHGVSGTVTVVDEDTLQVDNFYYDGTGIVVLFYLGASDAKADFANGLAIGDDLIGPPFNGDQLTVDLPSGSTIDGYGAISVWCVAAGISFGSGTFFSPGDFDMDGDVDVADLTLWQRGGSPDPHSVADLAAWRDDFGIGSGFSAVAAVPEPSVGVLMLGAGVVLFRRRVGLGAA